MYIKWTPKMLEFLKNNQQKTDNWLSNELSRLARKPITSIAVRRKRQRMGFIKQTGRKPNDSLSKAEKRE